MRVIARFLNGASGGRLSPNTVTIIGLLMHIPIALLIVNEQFYWAAGLLVIFGLFDSLDGELARLQGKASPAGMLLDSVTDRMKEVILYMGVGYILATEALADNKDVGLYAALMVAVVGGSMLTSYVNAWGEVVMTRNKKDTHTAVNQAFRGGLMRFEVRMFLLVVALLTQWFTPILLFVALFSWLTAVERLAGIIRRVS